MTFSLHTRLGYLISGVVALRLCAPALLYALAVAVARVRQRPLDPDLQELRGSAWDLAGCALLLLAVGVMPAAVVLEPRPSSSMQVEAKPTCNPACAKGQVCCAKDTCCAVAAQGVSAPHSDGAEGLSYETLLLQ